MAKQSEVKQKIKSFVLAAHAQDGTVPKTASIAEVLNVPKQTVSNVISALRLGGALPELIRKMPKGRVRGANAIVDFVRDNQRLPTAEEVNLTPRVFKHALTRATKKGEIVVSHSVPA